MSNTKQSAIWAVVVAQLAKHSLPTPARGPLFESSHCRILIYSNCLPIVDYIEKKEIKKRKEGVNDQF